METTFPDLGLDVQMIVNPSFTVMEDVEDEVPIIVRLWAKGST